MKLDEDDLEHIVDTYSDDEGDEDLADEARAKAAQLEEKARHKEMMRRMKEGYDGRRGGVSGARGKADWNELVSAGGREEARKLGLLNSDEENSDDENEPEKSDDEDEVELLDRMLKERHGMTERQRLLAMELAESSDSESDDDDDAGSGSDEDEKEEREQELLAKRIAKRAKMQRILAEYTDSQQQSQLGIDDDEDIKADLSLIKGPAAGNRWASNAGSRGGFVGMFGEDSNLGSNLGSRIGTSSSDAPYDSNGPSLFKRLSQKRPLADASSKANSADIPGASELALSRAVSQSRKAAKKFKPSSFLSRVNSDDGSSRQGRSAASAAGSTTLVNGHVLFDTNSKSAFGAGSNIGGGASRQGLPPPSDKVGSSSRPINTVTPGVPQAVKRQGSSSLWSKIKSTSSFS